MPHIIYAWQEIKGWASMGIIIAWYIMVGSLVLLLACYYVPKVWLIPERKEEMTC